MDELSQLKFNEITKKEILALTASDIIFLKARRSYLTKAQEEFYSEVLSSKPQPTKPEPDLKRSRSYRAMQRQAKELGLPFIGVRREDLERSIDTAVGPS